MAEAHAKHHDYHLVNPSPWPFIGSIGAFAMALGGISFMHGASIWWIVPGLLIVLYTMASWWTDVIKEGQQGYHTRVVQLHLRYGMILFIASEVMFFVAWFWAFFDASLFAGEAQNIGRFDFTGGHCATPSTTSLGNRAPSKKAQNQATKNITSEAMNRIMP